MKVRPSDPPGQLKLRIDCKKAVSGDWPQYRTSSVQNRLKIEHDSTRLIESGIPSGAYVVEIIGAGKKGAKMAGWKAGQDHLNANFNVFAPAVFGGERRFDH